MKIALSGRCGSGKTTVAQYLVEKFADDDNHRYIRGSFAKGVKDVATKYFRMDPLKKDRALLQKVGVAMREIDSEVWVNTLLDDLDVGTPSFDKQNIVVDDMRFPNEYVALKRLGFVMVRLEASAKVRKKRIPDTYCEGVHISETAIDDFPFDYTIISEGPIKELHEKINDVIYNELLSK